LLRRGGAGTVSSKRASEKRVKDSIVTLRVSRNERGHRQIAGGPYRELEGKHGQNEWVLVFAKIAAEGRERRAKLEGEGAIKKHHPRAVLPAQVQLM
jgi:hypothetical protein